jgi:hypothetical protein
VHIVTVLPLKDTKRRVVDGVKKRNQNENYCKRICHG